MKAEPKSGDWSRGKWIKQKDDRGVFQRGKVYYIRFMKNGKLVVERSGLVKGDALNLVKLRKGRTDDERNHPEKYRAAVLFDEIADDVIKIKRDEFEATYKDRDFVSGRYEIVKGWFLGRKVSTITTEEIRAKLAKVGKKPATRNRYRVVLGHIFRVAIENKKANANENPIEPIKLLDENNEIVRYLNQYRDDEEAALRKAIAKSRYPQREPEMDLTLALGLRQQELYRLKWKDVDLKRSIITIRQPKGGQDQYLPLNTSARSALTKLAQMYPKSELVAPLGYDSSHRRWWVSVRKRAKLDGFRWHDLRHTYGSRLAMAGVDIFTINRLMRHSKKSLVVTMRYAHLSDEHLQREIAKLDAPAQLIQPTDTRVEHVQ